MWYVRITKVCWLKIICKRFRKRNLSQKIEIHLKFSLVNNDFYSGSGTKDYTCGLCDFKCSQESTVLEHVALQHLNIFQFKCAHCGIKFKLRLVGHLVFKIIFTYLLFLNDKWESTKAIFIIFRTQLENHEREKHRLKMFPEMKNEDGFEVVQEVDGFVQDNQQGTLVLVKEARIQQVEVVNEIVHVMSNDWSPFLKVTYPLNLYLIIN